MSGKKTKNSTKSAKKHTVSVRQQMLDAAKEVIDAKLARRKELLDEGHIAPSYDLRDWTSPVLIYGMKKYPVRCKPDPNFDGDRLNLGNILTGGRIVPQYKFFRFKDLCRVFTGVVKEVGFNTFSEDIEALDAIVENKVLVNVHPKRIVRSVVGKLANNDKYWLTLRGHDIGYRICIFRYGGSNTDHLSDLAERFRKRDAEEAMAVSRYYAAKMADSCERVSEVLK